MLKWIVVCITLAVGGGAAWAADTAAGKGTYDKSCASCHGADGRGKPDKAKILKLDATLLDLGREEARALSRDAKRKTLVEGKGKMPAFGAKLAPADVDPVLDYALSLNAAAAAPAPTPPPVPVTGASKPAEPAAPPAAAADLAKKAAPLWKKSCAGCHGAAGAGKPAKEKALKLEPGTLNLGRDAAASMSRDDKRKAIADGVPVPKMPGYAKKLKPPQIDLLTDYSVELANKLRAKR